MKGIVAGLSTAFCYIFIFLSAFTFPLMNQWQFWQGPFGTFLLYALIALIGLKEKSTPNNLNSKNSTLKIFFPKVQIFAI